ncbi:MAG: hypothetical protein H6630_09400 [Arcobacter sp.]|nr:hypothetical protein [Arcobacter sp.]MCB9226163.1 hypothetical protein [Chitinophagales bacterium]
MSGLTLKLIILIIPGAISTIIFGKLILHKPWSNFTFLKLSVLFGIFSFLILQVLISTLNLLLKSNIKNLNFWNSLNENSEIPFVEVFLACVICVPLSFIVSLIENRKIISKVATKLNISYKYGEENLYSRFLNSQEIEVVYIRDKTNKLIYHGWVKSFSENDTISEISLEDVIVYQDGKKVKKLYDINSIYLCFNKKDIIIETAKKIKDE